MRKTLSDKGYSYCSVWKVSPINTCWEVVLISLPMCAADDRALLLEMAGFLGLSRQASELSSGVMDSTTVLFIFLGAPYHPVQGSPPAFSNFLAFSLHSNSPCLLVCPAKL